MYRMDGFGAAGFLLMLLFLLLLGAAVVAAVAYATRGTSGSARGPAPGAGPGAPPGAWTAPPGPVAGGWPTADAERVLAERFARGEIDEAEYRSRLAVLRGAPPSG